MPGPESHGTREMVLIKPPLRFRAFELHAHWSDATAYPPAADCNDPGKARIDQRGRLRPVRQQPHELDRAFIPMPHDADLFRTRQALVARHTVQRIAKGACVKRGDRNGIVALDSLLASEFEADSRIAADFGDGVIQREHLLGCYPNLALLKQPYG